jgi:hypothetical protein
MAESSKDRQPPESPPVRRRWATAIGTEATLTGLGAFARAGFSDPTLVLRWGEIAGAETARLATPIRLTRGPSGGVLTLKAEPGAALFLQHDSRSLCERINAYLGRPEVVRLRFVQGGILRRTIKEREKPRTGPVPDADPATTYQGPEGLREALLRLARSRRGLR